MGVATGGGGDDDDVEEDQQREEEKVKGMHEDELGHEHD